MDEIDEAIARAANAALLGANSDPNSGPFARSVTALVAGFAEGVRILRDEIRIVRSPVPAEPIELDREQGDD